MNAAKRVERDIRTTSSGVAVSTLRRCERRRIGDWSASGVLAHTIRWSRRNEFVVVPCAKAVRSPLRK